MHRRIQFKGSDEESRKEESELRGGVKGGVVWGGAGVKGRVIRVKEESEE